MTPDELRLLADEATPGPWEYHAGIPPWEPAVAMTGSVYARDDSRPLAEKPRTADACLIALAPDLARLCAELGKALEVTLAALSDLHGYILDPDVRERVGQALAQEPQVALAKLSELKAVA